MDIKSKMRNDMSGVGALIAVVVVVIVVVAAAAAYVVLSGGEDEENETIAPGTWKTYGLTVNGTDRGEIELTVIGQNKKEYFMMAKMGGDTPVIQYALQAKKAPKDLEIKGTEELETFEGTKTLEVWEYSLGSKADSPTAISYIDPANELSYRDEITYADPSSPSGGKITEIRTLKDYELVYQDSYKESKWIGVSFEYAYAAGSFTFPATITCVADCLDGQYGMVYDVTSLFGLELCFLSDGIHGLPSNAANTAVTATLSDSIDGDVPVEVWRVFEFGAMFTFYSDPDTHLIYGFVVTAGGKDYGFDLVKKPDSW